MEYAAVLVRGPAAVLRDVQRDPLPTAGSGARHEEAPLGRKTLLSPADMTQLSEHIMRVTGVLCFSAVTIKSLVHEWLDAEGLDVRAGEWWSSSSCVACT